MIFDHYIDPILLEIGPLSIRYYGLFVVIGIIFSLWLWKKYTEGDKKKFEILFDLLIWLIIGGGIGARFGHIVFYELDYYLANPGQIIMVQNGGLASHGLTIGLALTFFLFVKIKKIKISEYLDLTILPIPMLVFLIRSANFINSEIVGRPTNGNWGVKYHFFEKVPVPRHPTQIYEALLGLGILVMNIFAYKHFNQKKKIPYVTFNLFVGAYFLTRFLVEFFKEYQTLSPSNPLTMGQYLSIIPVLFSVGFFVYIKKKGWFEKKS